MAKRTPVSRRGFKQLDKAAFTSRTGSSATKAPRELKTKTALQAAVQAGVVPKASRPFALFFAELLAKARPSNVANRDCWKDTMKKIAASWRQLSAENKNYYIVKSRDEFAAQRERAMVAGIATSKPSGRPKTQVQTNCQVAVQTNCQVAVQTNCQVTVQTNCQTNCQTTTLLLGEVEPLMKKMKSNSLFRLGKYKSIQQVVGLSFSVAVVEMFLPRSCLIDAVEEHAA